MNIRGLVISTNYVHDTNSQSFIWTMSVIIRQRLPEYDIIETINDIAFYHITALLPYNITNDKECSLNTLVQVPNLHPPMSRQYAHHFHPIRDNSRIILANFTKFWKSFPPSTQISKISMACESLISWSSKSMPTHKPMVGFWPI